ncbi:hypothetical protein ASPSYDRAFT_50979 [Aspergillus sydowii CBS 593.65]|uniref:Hem-containing dehydratase protein n=1 Tax=Aspergillus sydowii CBS 593.65 TaxID=1036612 RepID=A0A1L9T1Z1_9EURO|nr:uncharacterized protein ASPSYDRAFT_50979 [Aspergillus sydowii CBS 593.65]OJJ53474.1 hypothetical protein ASPSYDRAFT_50979 [Aspergillus sydowii CBS 593.65]
MWGTKLPAETPIVTTIFGIQHHSTKDTDNSALINTFNTLITNQPARIENLKQDNPVPTRIWLTYWPSPAAFQKWWTSEPVASFWASLPDDAGVYREILTVPPGRTQHGTNVSDRISGMAHLGEFESILDKSGYWGCYYDRMGDVTKENKFRAEVTKKPTRTHLLSITPSSNNNSSNDSNLPICRGRIEVRALPDNIAFVVEGQDHSLILPEEKEHWIENFNQPVTNWISDLVAAGPEKGILDSRLCYNSESGMFKAADAQPRELSLNDKVQLFYFLDMEAMEKIGRENAGHVKLTRGFMQSYGSGGVMAELPGKLRLWVEASILKGRDMDCEYVGCVEGTVLNGLNWD